MELTVPNEPKTGNYNIQLEKVDSLNNATKLQGAEFEVKVNGGTAQKLTTDENGQLNINDINLTAVGKQTITIKETKAPNGYNKLLTGDLTIEATVGEDADKFKVTGVTITSGSESGSTAQVVQGTINTVKVTVPNEKITGKYNLQVIKVDSNNSNTKLQGAEFEVKVNGGTVQKLTTDENGQLSINDIKLENQEKQTITIKETKAPDGYYQLLEEELTLEATVGLEDGKYKVTNVQIKNTDKKGSTAVLEGSTVKVTVPNEKITGKYNLQLVKVDKDDTTKTLQGAEFEIKVNGGEAKTATTDSNGQLSINDLVIESKGKQTITIKETKAPEGYKKILTGELTIEATVEVIDNKYEVTSAQITSSNANGSSVRFVEDRAGAINKVIVTVPNEKITGKYNLQLIKVDSNDTSKKLSGAEFEIKVNGGEARTATTDTNGQININDLILESKGKQTITIKETNAPNKYKISLTEELTIEATVDVVNDEYKVTSAVIKNADAKGSNVTLDGSTVKVTVPNEKIVGNYNIKVVKEDVNGNKLAGAKFKVELLDNQNNVVKTYENLVTNAEGVAQTENIQVSEEATYTYRVTETEAPSKYIKEDTATIIKVTSKFVDGEYAIEYQKVSGNEKEISLTGNTVQVTMVNKQIDLALRKSITKLNDTDVNRLPDVDSTKLTNKTETTANYNHAKTPVLVDTGDYIVYTLRIYNEGTIGAYAGEIKDYLPAGIKYIEGINTNGKYKIEASSDGRTLTITNVGKQVIPAYNGEGTPKYDEIQIKCQITAERTIQPVTLTNIAEITKYIDEKGTERTSDRDSEPGNFPEDKKTDRENYNGSGKDGNYVKGQQDDDDFERVILRQQFDLSLRKVITEVDGVSTGNDRKINITGLSELKDGTQTTANYNHVKTPVTVENGSIVKYNINIYNEAAVDGIATIVKDQLPTGVKLNLSSLTAEGEKYYLTSTKGNKYEVNYNEQTNEITFTLVEQKANLAAFVGRNTLDQDTLEFTCTVNYVADTKQNTYFTNIAYIYEEKTADGIVITNQQKEDRDSEPYTNPTNNNKNKADDLKTVGDIGYKGNESNPSNLSQTDTFYKGQQDDDDFEKLVMKPKAFDLKLIKYITEVNGLDTENRVLSIDMSKINTQDPTTGKQITTGDYKLQKNPVAVEAGDFVTYTFRIYNEGDYDGYAEEISENLPEGLEFVVVADDTIYAWDGKELKDVTQEAKDYNMYEKILNTNNVWKYNKNSSIITTDILSKQKSNDNIIKAYGIEGYNNYADKANKIDYKELSVIFKVKADINPNETIRNEAAISKDTAIDKQGSTVDVDDRDSTPGNNDDSWKKDNSDKFYDEDKKWPIYGEDDEDYDNIITKAFDLSLRKQIVKINDDLYSTRFARLDTTNSEQNTIYNYYDVNSHKPAVKAGDIVTYSIRVYNEGQIDGYAKLVVDDLPSGLEFYSSTYNGVDYGWTKVQGTEKTYQTDFLSYEKDTNKGTSKSTLIKAYTGSGEADYKEIYMVCKVKDDVTTKDSLLNVAQIADDSGSRGNSVKDKDSIPGKTDKENKWKNEDDLDIENLRLKEFDLSLRKFITETETTSGEKNLVAGRNPVVSYDNGKLKYTHTKDPLTVHVGDVVTYTLRVYNEGEIDGYAATVKDNIPEYLEYLPDMATNKAYEWKMFDKDGKETTNVKDAVYVETEYLAKGHGEEAGNENSTKNLIKAFDSNKEISSVNPAYKEVKIAFKVKDPNSNKLIITNFAEISEDTDSEGKPVIDKDSTPNNGKGTPTEDDEDIENIKVEYFDLSLLKYVTKVIVNENGKQSVTQTKNVGDKNDVVPRVEINKDNINKTQVKFGYTIKVTNEGDIAGYAKEVTDYIPAGLKFDAKDNPNWKDEGNNIISTRALENTLLQPGQSAEVEVILTWINGQDNLGSKINTAEISEDYNNKGVPDRDSTPDNRKPGEDDIDTAEVLLSIKTGGGLDVVYVRLALGLLVVMLIGTVAIKKFVL
ncbi:MAG: hypothetical protein IJV31_06390 [Clostridia bacterium]|nr:hypothetical protein [Clostridia bacterium]